MAFRFNTNRPMVDARALGARCDECPLRSQKPVPPEVPRHGERHAPLGKQLVVLGESPGERENEEGRPFIGPSGRRIDKCLAAVGIDRRQVHVTNTVLCKPKEKMLPVDWAAAIECCRPRLDAELGTGKVVLALGNKAMQYLTGKGQITNWMGAPTRSIQGHDVLPSLHPAFVLRKPAYIPILKEFVRRAVQLSRGLLPTWEWPKLIVKGPYAIHLEKLLADGKTIALDIENFPDSGIIRCIGVGTTSLAVSVPLLEDGDASLDDISALRRLLSSSLPKALHNSQFDLLELKARGWEVNGPIYDTILAHAVVAPQLPHDLSFVAASEYSAPRWKSEFKIVGDDKRKGAKVFEGPLVTLLPYNAKDVVMTAKLHERLQARIEKTHRGQELLDEYHELNLISMKMKEWGIHVERANLEGHRTDLNALLFDLQRRFRELVPSEDAILGANGQNPSISKLFLSTFALPVISWNKETLAPSLDGRALTSYIGTYATSRPIIADVARIVLAYRKFSKLKGSYVDTLPVDAAGFVHPTWRIFGARTGRWSATDPAMQTIPKEVRYKLPNGAEVNIQLRNLFRARPGYVLVEADYSQLELRIVAMLAGDEKLLTWYSQGKDVHTMNAMDIWGADWGTFDANKRKKVRDLAKRVVYGCVPLDTQALTRKGWKYYKDLSIGDEILTYNAQKGVKEWAPIERFTYHETAEIWEMTNRSFRVRTTPDHRWFVRQRQWGERSYKRPYMHPVEVRTTETINTESNIVCNAPMTPDAVGVDLSTALSMKKYGSSWTELICGMTSEARRAFLIGFLLADGHQAGRKKDVWGWCQNKGEIADAALAASFIEHEGAVWFTDRLDSPSPMWAVKLSKKSHVTGQELRRKRVTDAPVWCPTTRNGSWVMKQGTCVTITGNCNYGGSADTIWRSLIVDFPGLPLPAIEHVLRGWYKAHPAIQQWQEAIKEKAAATGYVEETISGRRQYYHDGKIKPTEVLNFPIQAAAGTLANKAVKAIAGSLNWTDEALLAQVHDSTLSETVEAKKDKLIAIVKESMEQTVQLNGNSVKFPVDVKWGYNLAQLKVA